MTRQPFCRTIRITLAGLSLAALLMLAGIGCTRKKMQDPYLVRVQNHTLSVSEFNQAVKAAGEEAFAGDGDIRSEALNELRMRVLNQLSEEMMISAFAADHGIAVTNQELNDAVETVKADYPDNTFEETLLENAISFQFWRNQLATRLLIEKVIAKELISPVQISADDITQYYKKNYPQGPPEGENADDINRRIVIHLRRQKAESAYKQWIDTLRATYPVDVNRQAWNDLIAAAHENPS